MTFDRLSAIRFTTRIKSCQFSLALRLFPGTSSAKSLSCKLQHAEFISTSLSVVLWWSSKVSSWMFSMFSFSRSGQCWSSNEKWPFLMRHTGSQTWELLMTRTCKIWRLFGPMYSDTGSNISGKQVLPPFQPSLKIARTLTHTHISLSLVARGHHHSFDT